MDQTMDMQISENKNRRDYIGIFDMFDDGRHLWFTSMECNALFKMSKQAFQVDYIGSFPDEEMYGYRLYTSINEWNGKLFFTPCSAHEIGVYDMKNKCFEKISIGITREDNDLSQVKYAKKYVSSFLYKDDLILIPCCYDQMVVYNITNGNVLFENSLFEYFYAKYNNCTTSPDAQFYLCWFAKRVNDAEIVFNLHCNKNILVLYNLKTGEIREQGVGSQEATFSLIEYDGKFVYLYDTYADMLVRWAIETGRFSQCCIADQVPEFQPCSLEHSFLNMAVLGEWLYLVPANTNVAVKVNTMTLEVVTVDSLSGECSIQCEGTAYLNLCKVFDDKLYLFGNRGKELITYGIDGTLQRISVEVSNDIASIIAEMHLADLLGNNDRWFSEEQVPLTRFINALTYLEKEKQEHYVSDEKTMSGNCGSNIYHLVKQNLLS